MASATQALQNYSDAFGQLQRSGGQEKPAWLQSLRQRGFERFSATGFPTTSNEDWRFTNVSAIAQTNFQLSRNGHRLPTAREVQRYQLAEAACQLVFVDGSFASGLSSPAPAVKGVRAASLADRVVLFVHGAGTPAEVAFDVPYQDYSWIAYLARSGFDVFSMDTTGYGRSTRPPAMNDPCNLSQEQQKKFVPAFLSAPCPASYSRNVTTIASDWNDIDGRRLHSDIAACGSCQHGGMVAGRPSRRRICRASSGKGAETRASGACIRAYVIDGTAGCRAG